MSSFDITKRLSLKTAGAGILIAGTSGIIKPAHAIIDPVSGGIIAMALGSAITAISNWFGADKRADVDRRLAAASYQHYWMTKLVGDKVITMDVAGDIYKNSLMTLGLMNTSDKDGTAFHIKSGLLYVERGNLGDTMNAKEGYLAANLAQHYDRMPIPVEPMETNNLSPAESAVIRQKLEDRKIPTSNLALIASRRYSTARYPTANGGNAEMVAFIDKSQQRGNSKHQVMYASIA